MKTSKPSLENALDDYYKAPTPPANLDARIAANLAKQPFPTLKRPTGLMIPKWAAAVISIVLLLSVTIFLVGPDKVWAAVLNLTGYIPGVGFIQTDGARILVEPVEKQQNEMVLRVEHLLASSERISLVITGSGFPQYAVSNFSRNITLRLANGTEAIAYTFGVNSYDSGNFKMTLIYHPLKKNPAELTIVWRFMLSPTNKEYQTWEIPLTLSRINTKELAQKYPPAYTPLNSSDIEQDIRIEVINVASTMDTTAIQVAVTSPKDMGDVWINPININLLDDLGNKYPARNIIPFSDFSIQAETLTTPGPTPVVFEQRKFTLEFPLIDANAKHYTLTINGVDAMFFPYRHLPLELGDHLMIGDEIPIDDVLTLAGYDIPIQMARVVEVTNPHGDIVPGLIVVHGKLPAGLESIDQVGVTTYSMTWQIYDPASRVYAAAWLPENFPSGKIELIIDRLILHLDGSWVLDWDAP